MNHFNKWLDWLAAENLDAASICLDFLIQFNEIDKIVVGVETAHKLEEIIAAASKNILIEIPDFSIEDKNLILPTKWKK
jgi:aryl-alcohol dehydrogenase-like predicted oxidoreductase